jgi:phosphonate transport system permease protein
MWRVAAAVVGGIAWSAAGTEVDLAALVHTASLGAMAEYAVRLFPPDVSPDALREVARGVVETFAISLAGTGLALAIALPLALLGTRTILFDGILYADDRPGWRRGVRMSVYGCARGALNALRTVPEIVWALVFVFAVGLGPFPGVLALAVHTAGVLGKLFSEVLEDVAPQPLEALHASGAAHGLVIAYGVLPQAFPQWLSFALYRWEVNIRAAAVLGFVGAGGLGQQIHFAINLFLEHRLLTLVLAIYLVVTVVDALSLLLRRRLRSHA